MTTPLVDDEVTLLLDNVAQFQPGAQVYAIHLEGWAAKVHKLCRQNRISKTNASIVLGMIAVHQKNEREAYKNLRDAIQSNQDSWLVHQCYLMMLFAFGRIQDVVNHIFLVRDKFQTEKQSIHAWLLNTGYIDNSKLDNHLFTNVCELASICKKHNILLNMVKVGYLEDEDDRWFRYSFLLNEPPETVLKIQEEWHDFMIDHDINVLGDYNISISIESTDLSVRLKSDKYNF